MRNTLFEPETEKQQMSRLDEAVSMWQGCNMRFTNDPDSETKQWIRVIHAAMQQNKTGESIIVYHLRRKDQEYRRPWIAASTERLVASLCETRAASTFDMWCIEVDSAVPRLVVSSIQGRDRDFDVEHEILLPHDTFSKVKFTPIKEDDKFNGYTQKHFRVSTI